MDVSLYKLISSLEPPPKPFLVSPATLLSLVSSTIDLLIEQQISATFWVKLPPGEIWRSEIQRYQQQVDGSSNIYVCQTGKPELTDSALENQASTAKTLLLTKNSSSIVTVQLPAKSQLRREYFLLVLSPQFSSLILAHRPKIKRQTKAKEKTKQKKTPPLVTVCSFESRVIQQVLDGIKQAITQSVREPALTRSQPQSITSAELLANWDSRFIYSPAPQSEIMGKLLIRQMQQQEQTLRSVSSDRVANLRLQNLEMQQALNLKDEFLGNLCQELRTPLTHMKAALSLLNSPQLKPPQKQRYLQILNTECDRQNSLITGLLEMVQLDRYGEHPALQPIRLSEIVPGVVSTYQPLAQEKGVMLGYTVSPELPAVSCLNPWLRQIVINLLHNSIKFTPTGGQVWVRARVQGNYVELEVRDTGIGIAPHEIPRIFNRFYRVRPVPSEDAGGAGLGLTIVQQILERCGGSISVKSKLGEGSTFCVLLPLYQSNRQQSTKG